MKLSKRIKKIIEYIDENDRVADIGCDHGYLGIGCLDKGVTFIQNVDNKIGPLNSARKNLSKYKNDNILFTLSDGLNDLDPAVDTVVISGMGGDLITKIVLGNLNKTKQLKKLIIVAHSKVCFLREQLTKYFSIVEEDLVEDNGKIYEIIIFDPNQQQDYSYEDYLLGPILRDKNNDLFIKKINKRLAEIDLIKKQVKKEEIIFEAQILLKEIKKHQ